MKRTVRRAVEIRVRDEAGEVSSEQALELDIGTGRVAFEVQRLIECATGARCTWLELSGQFPHGHYLTPALCEVAAYYSNRLSYEEVAGLVRPPRGSGSAGSGC